jgi:signal transduction histidine kinase
VGFVYLRADLREIDQRLRRYAVITGVVLLISLLAASVASAVLGKAVARPIIDLAETAQMVSRNANYSLRATPAREHDELEILTGAFNNMLGQIQQRDTALQTAQTELEHKVAERTRDLLYANRELEAFSYSVSHDLRGPLDAINGFSYVLLKQHGAKLDEQSKEVVEHIRSSSKRMRELIDDLLNLSRVTTSTVHFEPVNLSAIARCLAEELCRSDPRRKVEFIIPETTVARGDSHLLRILLDNLLRNSWKYTSAHAHARIEFGSQSRSGQIVYS